MYCPVSPDSLDSMREPGTQFSAAAAHGFITQQDAALEQQLFNVTQGQLKPEVPANGTTDALLESDVGDRAI
jgi:hypothetical protein